MTSFSGWGTTWGSTWLYVKRATRANVGQYAQYVPRPLPGDPKQLPTAVFTELRNMATVFRRNDWLDLNPVNGWVAAGSSYASPAASLLPNGVVQLRGAIKSGTIGGIALWLPFELQPFHTIRCICASSPGSVGILEFAPDGSVTVVGGSNSHISFDGVSYLLQ